MFRKESYIKVVKIFKKLTFFKAQPINESLLQTCRQLFLCGPLVTVAPFDLPFKCPVVLSVSGSLLSRPQPGRESRGRLEDFVYLYRLCPG